MSRLLSTDAVDARERLAFWNEAVSDTYVRLDTTAPGRDVVGETGSTRSPRSSSPG
ncbi:MAG: hypothetical protein ACRDQ0_16110 [Pseudonocardia sp.]